MQHTKQAKLAVLASVLIAASILGGLSMTPALAQQAVATKQISQSDDDSSTIAAVDLNARKATLRTAGTISVNILQDGDVIDSADVSTTELTTQSQKISAEFSDPVTIQGSFNVTAEYLGSGLVFIDDMSIVETTENDTDTAGDDGSNDNSTGGDNDDQTDLDMPSGIQIANIPRSHDDSSASTIDEISFDARKVTLRTTGDLFVVISQGEDVRAIESLDAASLDTEFSETGVTFDALGVTGDYEVTFVFLGAGLVQVGNIGIAGDTGTSGDDDGSDDNGSDDGPELPPGQIQLTVDAKDQNGAVVEGLWVAVMDGFTMVDSSYTEAKFNLTSGDYTVMVNDFTDGTTTWTFAGWEDSVQGKTRSANLTSSETFTALYNVHDASSAPPPTTNPPPTGGANTVTVYSQLLDGSDLTGMKAELRDSSGTNQEAGFTPATLTMQPSEDYRVVMYSFDNNFFRNWADGGLHRYHAVNADESGQSLMANYEHIDDNQKAKLRVVAVTADGQPIGGTTGRAEDGTLVAEPGVEVQIAPPGSMTPYTAYTAGYSGGSEIEEQFYFMNHQTYVIIMTSFDQYQFSHWEDNDSTNNARAYTLDGDVTLTAVYDVVQ